MSLNQELQKESSVSDRTDGHDYISVEEQFPWRSLFLVAIDPSWQEEGEKKAVNIPLIFHCPFLSFP